METCLRGWTPLHSSQDMADKRLVDLDRQKGTLSPSFPPTRPPSLLLWRDVRGVITKIEDGI